MNSYLGLLLCGDIMNYKIIKMNRESKEKITDFIGNECLKMYLEDNSNYEQVFKDKNDLELTYKNFNILRNGISNNSTVYAAFLEDEVIGAGIIEENGYLEYLFVKEEYRNLGIGTNLLKKMIEVYGENKVINVDARIESINLYKRFSFKRTDNAKHIFVPMERNVAYAK